MINSNAENCMQAIRQKLTIDINGNWKGSEHFGSQEHACFIHFFQSID